MYVASPPRHIHTQNVNLNTTLPMVYTLTRKKKIQRQNLEISGQNKKQLKYRFHIKKRGK